ncbi:uncharacterized protein TNCT_563151 [Trichonephila clavata]|uniref:Gustatory receptor n=1 Tax=Trichonephila clavata TaxID=2740835 RepID=A0A8X6GDK6_TRICU|nr:uncharacterized protein TNCT_563151 [Trichonephila clavata]
MIFPLSSSSKDKAWIRLCKKFFATLRFAISIAIAFCVAPLIVTGNDGKNIALSLTGITFFINRCALTVKIGDLMKIPRKLEVFEVNNYKIMKWIKVLGIASIMMLTFLTSYVTFLITTSSTNKSKFLLFTFQESLINTILGIANEMSIFLFGIVPMMGLMLFYTAICLHIRMIITDFTKNLLKQTELNYNNILRSYVNIKTMVEYVDGKLSFLVFNVVIYNSCSMFNSVTDFFHFSDIHGFVRRLALHLYFVIFFILFIIMTSSAALVTDASVQVGTVAMRISAEAKKSSLSLQNFLSCAEKRISLTVWNVSPISRNFIFGLLGAMFTYVILFDSLVKKNNCV